MCLLPTPFPVSSEAVVITAVIDAVIVAPCLWIRES